MIDSPQKGKLERVGLMQLMLTFRSLSSGGACVQEVPLSAGFFVLPLQHFLPSKLNPVSAAYFLILIGPLFHFEMLDIVL